ncbi:MAG: hypothetical protein WDO56_07965 [Gammaproteobacteria bacterium]
MQTNRPVPIESRALGTLSYIRASIDAASSLAVPGLAGIVMGIIGVAACVLTYFPLLDAYWIITWFSAAALGFVLGGALVARHASQRNGALLSAPFKKLLLCLCPALFAGGVLSVMLLLTFKIELVSGTWLLLYGCAVVSASTVTNARYLPAVASMGGLFMVLGVAAFILPPSTHTILLGVGFGGLHLIYGILIGRINHGD